MPENTSPDFTCYVALGDSITAGYADSALYREAQYYSYARILAEQFGNIGGSGFRQPLMPADSVGIDPTGNAKLILKKDEKHPSRLLVVTAAKEGDLSALNQSVYVSEGPFHNMGVPGAKVTNVPVPGFGNPSNGPGSYNPFFTRMASDPEKASVLSDALALKPTFFSLFIGNNDALAYALSGCTINSVTPASGFEQNLRQIVSALTATGARGVVANLPSIEFIPYFTCIPYNGLLLTADQAESLTKKYSAENLSFHEGKNPFTVTDPSQGVRLLKEGELILMDVILNPAKNDYLRGLLPLPKLFVISQDEVKLVKETIAGYNQIIRQVAQEYLLAHVDVHALVTTARPDRVFNPGSLLLEFKRKGVFSLDGLHPNPFGQSIIANEFIKTINASFGTEIPFVRSIQYPGLEL